MPASNPIIGGRHVSSYASSEGVQGQTAPTPTPAGRSSAALLDIGKPVAVIVGVALLIVLGLLAFGVRLAFAARVGRG